MKLVQSQQSITGKTLNQHRSISLCPHTRTQTLDWRRSKITNTTWGKELHEMHQNFHHDNNVGSSNTGSITNNPYCTKESTSSIFSTLSLIVFHKYLKAPCCSCSIHSFPSRQCCKETKLFEQPEGKGYKKSPLFWG